jgi:hypothetical protein
MAQHFEPSSEMQSGHGSELRTQRMTADESRAVIGLWQQERVEQTGLTDKPAVPDVAEGLDITVEDVQRLLQEVRAKRLQEECALMLEQELAKVRIAEANRQFAEIQRQQAEMQRQRPEEPNEIMRGFLPGFVAIAFVVGMALLLTALSQPQPIR